MALPRTLQPVTACDRNLRFHAINWQCTASQLEVKPESTGLSAAKSMASEQTWGHKASVDLRAS